jgi:hypothetical protein
MREEILMRTFIFIVLLLLASTICAAFYFGVCTFSTDRDDHYYTMSLAVRTDLPNGLARRSNADDAVDQSGLTEAKGKIASVNPEKNQVVVTENIKNLTFQLENNAMVALNDTPCKLGDLRGGDEARVIYTKQGQNLVASLVQCTRK